MLVVVDNNNSASYISIMVYKVIIVLPYFELKEGKKEKDIEEGEKKIKKEKGGWKSCCTRSSGTFLFIHLDAWFVMMRRMNMI